MGRPKFFCAMNDREESIGTGRRAGVGTMGSAYAAKQREGTKPASSSWGTRWRGRRRCTLKIVHLCTGTCLELVLELPLRILELRRGERHARVLVLADVRELLHECFHLLRSRGALGLTVAVLNATTSSPLSRQRERSKRGHAPARGSPAPCRWPSGHLRAPRGRGASPRRWPAPAGPLSRPSFRCFSGCFRSPRRLEGDTALRLRRRRGSASVCVRQGVMGDDCGRDPVQPEPCPRTSQPPALSGRGRA